MKRRNPYLGHVAGRPTVGESVKLLGVVGAEAEVEARTKFGGEDRPIGGFSPCGGKASFELPRRRFRSMKSCAGLCLSSALFLRSFILREKLKDTVKAITFGGREQGLETEYSKSRMIETK